MGESQESRCGHELLDDNEKPGLIGSKSRDHDTFSFRDQ